MADMDPGQLDAFLTAQMKKQGGGGMTEGQAAALSRFWKSQRARVREALLAQSRWERGLRGLTWRVDLQTSSSAGQEEAPGGPVALLELELARGSQVSAPCLFHSHPGHVTYNALRFISYSDVFSTTLQQFEHANQKCNSTYS